MLLSGPERMSQNLAALADVLGSALKIERRVDESLTDYMGRLIDGIAALPAADRLKLQKLLAQSFAGLQLRTLLDAMANPSGPERTTLALYLERRSGLGLARPQAAATARRQPPSLSRAWPARQRGACRPCRRCCHRR